LRSIDITDDVGHFTGLSQVHHQRPEIAVSGKQNIGVDMILESEQVKTVICEVHIRTVLITVAASEGNVDHIEMEGGKGRTELPVTTLAPISIGIGTHDTAETLGIIPESLDEKIFPRKWLHYDS
jgi:hypothetical protein